MLNYLIRRVGALALVVIGVVTIVFFVVRAVPGDPVASILGERALAADKQALRQCLNLDHSLLEQYRLFWGSVLDGTFGHLCGERGVTVMDKLIVNIPPTFQLALAALAVAILIAVPLGVAAALKPYSWVDNTSMAVAMIGISVPNFWLGPMLLILFSITLEALPDPGSSVAGLQALVLPAVTLGTALAAKLTRMTRSSMLEVLGLDYVRTAKAKGAQRWRVVIKHALRNALIPVVTILGLQFGALLTGAIVVEKIFARPGLGTLLLDAIQQRNYRVVQGCVIFISLSYVVVNLVTDLVYAQIDPRIRYEQKRFPVGGWSMFIGIWLIVIGQPLVASAFLIGAVAFWLWRYRAPQPA
ncbi:MAG: ABC transporter permease [Bradymonadaceae bacterium]